MTIPYTPNPVFPATITLPKDGDAANEEAFVGIQEVADRTQQLKGRDDAQDATLAGHSATLSDVAHKNQQNVFTQTQVITGVEQSTTALDISGELSAYGHIIGGKSVYAGSRGLDDGNPNHSWEFVYGQFRSRTVTIAPASGVGSGNVAALWSDTQGTPIEGYQGVLQPGEYVFYPIVVPHGATMKTVVVKLASPGVTYDARLIRRYAMVMTDTSLPKYQIKARVDDIALSGTTANRTLDWGNITADASEDYALYIKNKTGGQPLHVTAIKFTYEEQFLRTYGSR